MKTPKEWSKECIRQFGYGVDPRLIEQVQADAKLQSVICGHCGNHALFKFDAETIHQKKRGGRNEDGWCCPYCDYWLTVAECKKANDTLYEKEWTYMNSHSLVEDLKKEITRLKNGIAYAATGLEQSTQPFDSACVTLRKLLE